MQEIIDRNGIIARLGKNGPVILELGCGDRKRLAGSVGIDILDYPGVDLVGDLCLVLGRIPDGVADSIYAYHVLEHVADLDALVKEVARVLKPGGAFDVVVPHFSNAYYYSDPTHRRPFGLYTFSYYADEDLFSRKVPHYWKVVPFQIEQVSLRFKSGRPFYFRYALRRLAGMIFDACGYAREFYEENLSGVISCYEIHYVLRRK